MFTDSEIVRISEIVAMAEVNARGVSDDLLCVWLDHPIKRVQEIAFSELVRRYPEIETESDAFVTVARETYR